jgi:hypothetical protein
MPGDEKRNYRPDVRTVSRSADNHPVTVEKTAPPGISERYFEEREKGFEPSTLALARRCSTTELFPQGHRKARTL